MIISHKHRFIFVKTLKTASTSMEVGLSMVLGPEDIITPASPDLDAQRSRGVGGQNYRLVHPDVPKIPLWRRILRRPERHYHPTVGYYEHMPAWQIRRYLGDATWNSYFKFAFERNPWDRQVSWYHYKTKSKTGRRKPTFDQFNRDPKKARAANWDLYTIDGAVALDFIGRYERLVEDFETVLARLGLRGQVELPKVNVSSGRSGDYRAYYTDQSRTLIESWYRPEIEHFGYLF
jgi:hypothetical protein